MPPFVASSLLVLLLAGPALLTPSSSRELEVRGQRAPRDTKQDAIKVVISEGCTTQGDSPDSSQGGKEVDLVPGSPLVLTHRIKLVPTGSGSGSCGCEADFAALRERLERLEREVSALREKCGGPEGGCCTSKESKGAGCSIKPGVCPNECSDQGRCVDGQCVCFPGFSGPDCSQSDCPDNCSDNGRCVNGQCVCDPGFTGPDCSQRGCPDNCNNRGRCVNGKCVCNPGFTGPDCSQRGCPDNCSNRGRCVNGRCVCDSGFTGPSCSDESCPGNCNNKGRCVNGLCVCDSGFTGPDCSKKACPDNCNNRGRCVNGRCVCDSGFTGPDCSENSCPGNCNDRGRCVNGQCVCDPGFTGPDCSEKACPDNCNNRGRCVDGQCVCNPGFTGSDCSAKACPNNCSNRGKCVNGKCVCDAGFAGPDCTGKGCPNNCSNKGRCVKGRCVCRRGFTGPDCSQCEAGMTGPNCDTVMSGVSQLSTQDITETSVTLIWTPPPVQYETYHITFTSQKEIDQQITVQVEGSLTTFTQTGLATGQEYTVTVTGEIDGRKGAESSTEFMTLISGPTNLEVVKTTTTSAVVQWEQSRGEIDRYRLTVSPSDGAGSSQEITVPAGRDSAQIEQLEAGRLYDIVLVAEKGTSQSEPATTQATPDKTIPGVSMAAVTTQVTPAPGQNVDDRDRASNLRPDEAVFDQQGRREDGSEVDSVKVGGITGYKEDSSSTIIARTKPLVSKKDGITGPKEDSSATVIARTKPLISKKDGTKPKPGPRPILPKKPKAPGSFRLNATRVGPGGKPLGPGPLKKLPGRNPLVGVKKKAPIVTKKPKPESPIVGDRTIALTVRDPSAETSSTESGVEKNPAVSPVVTDSEVNSQSISQEPIVRLGSKEEPDVGTAVPETGDVRESAEHTLSSEPTGTIHTPEKKCMNKIKVTHIRLPHKSKAGGCKGDGTVIGGRPNTRHSSSETEDTDLNLPDLPSSSAETTPDDLSDPLHKLLTDTFDGMNIKTFSVHLLKPSNISHDATTVSKRILSGLKPLPSSSSSSLSFSPSSSSSSLSSVEPSSSSLSPAEPSSPSSSSSSLSSLPSVAHSPSSSSSLASPSLASSSSAAAVAPPSSSLTLSLSTSSPSSLPLPSSSPSSSVPSSSSYPSSSEKSDLSQGNEPEVDTSKNGESTTDAVSPEANQHKKFTSREGEPLFRPTFPKGGYRRPNLNLRPFQNRTNVNTRRFYRPSSPLNLKPGKGTEMRQVSSSELSSSSSSTSEESFSVDGSAPKKDTDGEKDGTPTQFFVGTEQNQTKTIKEGGPLFRRVHPKKGYPNRFYPNMRPFQNRTRPIMRLLRQPSQPLNPEAEIEKEHSSSSESPTPSSSSSTSEESYPVESTLPEARDTGDKTGTSILTEETQTSRDGGAPPFHRPPAKVGYPRRPHPNMGPFQNRTRPILRPPQYPKRRPLNQSFPSRKQIGGSGITVQSSQTGEGDTPRIAVNQPEEDHSPMQGVQIIQSGEQDTTGVTQSGQTADHDNSLRVQTSSSGEEDSTQGIQTTQSGEKETTITDSGSDIHKERATVGKHSGTIIRGRPTIKQNSPNQRPPTLLRRKPQTGEKTAQGHIQMRKNISVSQREQDSKTNTGKGPGDADSSPSGDTREPLDNVGVTNITSDGFTVVWDAPEGKYKNFVVTRREQGRKQDKKPNEKEKKEEQGEKGQEEDSEQRAGTEEEEDGKQETAKGGESVHGRLGEENTIPESDITHMPRIHSSTTTKPAAGSGKIFKEVLPGSARFFPFKNLPPQTEYTVTLLGKGPGLLSRLHKLVISTGPEPPTNLVFSELTENSLTLSWTKPKSPVSSFKVTYTHTEEGEPVSVSVDSEDATLGLSKLSPGSTYEVSVISVLGLDESDPVKDFVMTPPDPPTDLRAINVTDNKALLLWRPALATVDKYAIVYGTGKGSDLRITVSGNAAEQQLSGLLGSTTYTVTISSQLGSLESSPATTTFTTSSGSGRDGEGPRDLQASQVTPRTARLSWIPPSTAVGSYKLTYQTEGQEMKEVIVDAAVTEYKLSRLHPGSKYTVELQGERGGRFTSAISTEFTTGSLRFPFPTDCSQELLNGIRESGEAEVFPQGKQGTPLSVYCDMETDGGGWTVFQRRKDGSVDFYREWKEYAKGFGNLSGEFWLGLNNIHNLTTMTRMMLRVDLRAANESVFAKYSTFEVAKRNYRLTVGGYSGTAGDSMSYHNNQLFSAKDRDLGRSITRCAMSYRGGWWYKNCHEANLNGLYKMDANHQGIIWTTWKGKEFSIPFTEMKMRPAAFSPPGRG